MIIRLRKTEDGSTRSTENHVVRYTEDSITHGDAFLVETGSDYIIMEDGSGGRVLLE